MRRSNNDSPIFKEDDMKRESGVTVHFTDGSTMRLEVPPQADNDYAEILKLKEVIKDRHLTFEVDGALLLIPFENMKYVEVYPTPTTKLSPNVIRGAKLSQ